MLQAIRSLFQKTQKLLLRRRVDDEADCIPPPKIRLRNFDAEAAKEAFRERFLTTMARSLGEAWQADNMSMGMGYVKVSSRALSLATLLSLTGFGTPFVFAGIALTAVHYVFVSAPRLNRTIAEATEEFVQNPQRENKTQPDKADIWMSNHIDQVAEYLDRLDRREEDLRRRDRILKRLATNPQTVLPLSDRELLERYDSHKFKLRAENPFPLLPSVAILSNWHYNQLSHSIRSDIRGRVRSRKSLRKAPEFEP